jgi:hypothetical protein
MGRLFFWILALVFVNSTAGAVTVFVEKVQGVAVPAEDLEVVEELIRSSVKSELKHGLAHSAGVADYAIGGKLMRLGQAYSLTLVKIKGQEEVGRVTMKASMMADMDVVVVRLVRSLDAEMSPAQSATVKDVTAHEERDERRRKQVLSQLSFALGPAWTSNLGIESSTILWNVGYNYELDFNWDMHVDGDWLSTTGASDDDAYFTAINFGVNYYFNPDQYAPFVEGHIGYGVATASLGCEATLLGCFSKDRASGWLAGAGLGFRFFRTSESNFAVVLRGSYMGAETSISHRHPAVASIMLMGFFH